MPRLACSANFPGAACAALCLLLVSTARAQSVTSAARAQPKHPAADGVSIPKELAPWAAWVLAPDQELACPVRDGNALCFWPGVLSLALDEHGGRFALSVLVDRQLAIGLPGGPGRWPLAVRVDGQPAALLARGDEPSIELSPGEHRIEGHYSWNRLPESLPLPPRYAQIELTLRGQRSERPKRAGDGSLWLQGESSPQEQAQLELIVARKLQDGVPMQVETRLRIRAAGQSREVDLGQVLLPNSVPMSVSSDLPVRLDAQGRMRLQVRAGSFSVRVLARLTAAPTRLQNVARPAPWPAEEVWVFQSDEALRQVQLSGARAVDAARVELDADWRGLPAYQLAQTDALSFNVTRRGDPEPVANQLQLRRTLWLDQDGLGYSVHDQLEGELHSGFRLELRGFDLGRVSLAGRDQLITREDALHPMGVELRDAKLDMSADWRADALFATLPAVAWSEDVRSLAVTLNMPPGYALFGVRGVDHVDRSWLQDWDLLGFFFVLLLALGTGRVAGIPFGVVAFVALGVSYHEPDAPSFVWIALLVVVALLRVIPEGRARKLTRTVLWLVVVGLAAQAVPFAARSLREAIYPQLAEHHESIPLNMPRAAAPAASPPEADADMAAEAAVSEAKAGASQVEPRARVVAATSAALSGSAQPTYKLAETKTKSRAKTPSEDPDAVVQTGPGLPDWSWQSWRLSWSGPVQRDHHFELWIMSPRLTRSLAVLRVLLCALLAYGLLRAGFKGPRPSTRFPSAPPAIAGLLLLAFSLLTTRAHAQFPDQTLLQELHTRLTRAPACRPNCVAVNELELTVDASGLRLRSETHAQDRTSVRLPGPLAVWAPESVRVDGAEAHVIAFDDGFLHVRVLPGVHRIEARGALPPQDTLTLRLGDAPAHVRVEHQGYDVVGVREDGSAEDSLELKRTLRKTSAQAESEEPVSLPAWLTLQRELDLGLEFRVHNRLQRETPTGSAVVVHMPLLPGESVNDSRIQIENGEAIATLAPDDVELTFDSGLAQRKVFDLVAAGTGPYSEVWRVRCSSMWRCQTENMVPVARVEGGQAVSVFRPWPQEKLHLTITKPQPAEGQATTVDSARFSLQPGIRQTDARLDVSMRTSRGGAHTIELPEGARVRNLSINGAERPVHNSARSLRFTLQPGAAQIALTLEFPLGMSALFHVPALKLDTRIVNARVTVKLVQDRWLLWLRGPAWGPAILFWGYLAFAVFVAVLLARIGMTPLKLHEWVLLALGLTQIDGMESLAVVGFFFLFALRARTTELTPVRHDLMQLGLVVATLLAASALFDAVQHGLLVQPDMQISGGGFDGSQLQWYVDHTNGALPEPTVITAPLWVYRALMLLWSLWLASRLLRWLPWAFRAFLAGGAWKRSPKRPPNPVGPPPWAATPPTPPTAG
jgi:hypothetical protein